MNHFTVVRQVRENGVSYEWVVVDSNGTTTKTMTGNKADALQLAAWLRKETKNG
jgi:hypothetical protein